MPDQTGKKAIITVVGGIVQDCIQVPAKEDSYQVIDYDNLVGSCGEDLFDELYRVTGLKSDQIASLVLDEYIHFMRTGLGAIGEYIPRDRAIALEYRNRKVENAGS